LTFDFSLRGLQTLQVIPTTCLLNPPGYAFAQESELLTFEFSILPACGKQIKFNEPTTTDIFPCYRSVQHPYIQPGKPL
jgi:hypothetical protein